MCKTTQTTRYRNTHRKMLPWFKLYVLKGRTYESLASQSRLSIRTLEHFFHLYLRQSPPSLSLPLPPYDPQYLIYDAIWFGKKFCLICYRIYQDPLIIHHSIRKTERSSQISRDLAVIKDKGYQIDGMVTDGGKGVVTAAGKVFPHTPHQICLAHMHRQATVGLGRHPKDHRSQRLRQLADHLFLIESKAALKWWLNELQVWGRVNRDYLSEKGHDEYEGRSWFKHRNARKTLRILLSASQYSFTFLKHPLMPKTTNGIEGIFSNLRIKWQIHKGLKPHRWPNFLSWFIYFRNQQILADRKQDIP